VNNSNKSFDIKLQFGKTEVHACRCMNSTQHFMLWSCWSIFDSGTQVTHIYLTLSICPQTLLVLHSEWFQN